MQTKEKCNLSHTILYSKGWYNKTNDVIEDLKRILCYDDFQPCDKNDIISILISSYEKSIDIRLINLISEIHPENCWKIGYHYEDGKYDYYTAVIYKILSDFRFLNNKNWIPRVPKYSKTEKRPDDISLSSVIERFKTK